MYEQEEQELTAKVWTLSGAVSKQIAKSIESAIGDGAFDHMINRRIRELVALKIREEFGKKLKSLNLEGIVLEVLQDHELYIDKIEKVVLQLAAEKIKLTMNEVKHEITKRRNIGNK